MERLHAPNEVFRIRRLREGMRAWQEALAESAIGAIGLEIESHLVDLDHVGPPVAGDFAEPIQRAIEVVDDDPGPLGQPFELPHRWRLQNIESPKKYKAGKQRLPLRRRQEQSNPLSRDLVDDYILRIF